MNRNLKARLRDLERQISTEPARIVARDGSIISIPASQLRPGSIASLFERAIEEREAGKLSPELRAIRDAAEIREPGGARLLRILGTILREPHTAEQLQNLRRAYQNSRDAARPATRAQGRLRDLIAAVRAMGTAGPQGEEIE